MKKSSDRYLKLVAWNEEDRCYVGRCPDLMLGGELSVIELRVMRGRIPDN
jgi:hypothetical protein